MYLVASIGSSPSLPSLIVVVIMGTGLYEAIVRTRHVTRAALFTVLGRPSPRRRNAGASAGGPDQAHYSNELVVHDAQSLEERLGDRQLTRRRL